MRLKSEDYKFIKDFCKDKRNLNDREISELLSKLKHFKDFLQVNKSDTLRRGVSFVRTYFKLREYKKLDCKAKYIRHIIDIIKKYPEQNSAQQAVKLKFRTNLTIDTCKIYIINYKNYGTF